MRNFFRAISDFFFSLFSGSREDVRKRRELRGLEDQLATLKPHVYKSSSNHVNEHLADAFYEFYQEFGPIGEILNKTIDHQDQKLAQKFRELVIDSRLTDSQVDKKLKFDFDTMFAAVSGADDSVKEMDSLRNNFNSFIEAYSSIEVRQANNQLSSLNLLATLHRHDWQGFFQLFDSRFKTENKTLKPKFASISADDALPHLLDFYYVLTPLSLDEGTEQALTHLAEKLAALNLNAPDMKIKKVLPKLIRLTRRHLSPEFLLTLIRVIKKDPVFKPKFDREKIDYVSQYRANMSKQFQVNCDRLVRERHENSLKADLDSLFGTVPLMKLKEYQEEANFMLSSENMVGFKYIQGMRILKTFAHAVYEKQIRMQIKKILIDGFFENKSFQNTLSSHYYKTENTIQQISDFESQLTEPGKHAMINLRKFLDQNSKGKNMILLINKFVLEVDERAQYIIESETNTYYQLATLMRELVEDYKRRIPEFVSNIKTIEGSRNREFIGSIADGYKVMVKFLKVMKNFAVIKVKNKENAV